MNGKNQIKPFSNGTGSVDSGNGTEPVDSPNFDLWSGLGVVSDSFLSKLLDFLSARKFAEIVTLIGTGELTLLARDLILTGGKGFPSPQGFILIVFLTLMIFSPALYHIYYNVVRNCDHAKANERTKNPTQSGNERGGS